MSRLLDFNPSEEDIVVSRVLVSVHKAIDMNFPNAEPAPTRYAKTSFGTPEETLTNIDINAINKINESEQNANLEDLERIAMGSSDKIIKQFILSVAFIVFTRALYLSIFP